MRSPYARALRHCVLLMLGAVCLALTLVAFTGQPLLVFLADFDQTATSSPGGGQIVPALGGQAILQGPPSVFDLAHTPDGDGYALLHGNPTAQPAYVNCVLLPAFVGTQCVISFELTRTLDPGDIVFRTADDNDVGAIDIVFDDDGDAVVVVGGLAQPIDLDPVLLGQPMSVQLELRDLPSGPSTWALTIQGSGHTYHANGQLGTSTTLRVGSMRFIRPAAELGGDEAIDDVSLVTTLTPDSSAQSSIRK